MSDDIVKRLRKHGGRGFLIGSEAADEIERQRQKRAEAEANLEAAHGVVVRLRAALEWLRGWRMKDHESIDCTIQHALGEAETCTVCHPHGNAALAGDAKPGMEGNERELEVMGGSVPASAPHRIPEAHDRAGGFKIPPVGEPWNSEDWNAGYEQGFADGRAAPPPPATEGKP